MKHVAIINAACAFTGGTTNPATSDTSFDCNTQDNDPIKAIKTALAADTTTYSDAVTNNTDAWEEDVGELAAVKKTQTEK